MAKPRIRNLPDLSHLARSGAEIAVHVTPGARQAAFSHKDGNLRIAVTVPPEDGKANEAVRKLLARALRVAPSRLSLLRGHTSRDKLFVYSGS
ncbi:DUF167 domain-containing protein [Pontibaca salina]|uniref:UPF0235 protein JAO82_05145 n=1 Tax=Pontibaca salina TaxID=2795731 RepID=A0A934M2X5_9RHOB|nr:DUF167 domain-containing protein [Pontibaca salina]MBI6629264.1 DUF167 domain-containing protein [Pontibaca salina]